MCWLVLVVAFGLGFGFVDLVFGYWRFGLNSVWVYGAWFVVICCFRYVGLYWLFSAFGCDFVILAMFGELLFCFGLIVACLSWLFWFLICYVGVLVAFVWIGCLCRVLC